MTKPATLERKTQEEEFTSINSTAQVKYALIVQLKAQ